MAFCGKGAQTNVPLALPLSKYAYPQAVTLSYAETLMGLFFE